MTVAVSGASGSLGSLVAGQLLDAYPAGDVVLLTRRPQALKHLEERGAVVRRADLDLPATLDPALVGVDRLLLISTTHESTPRRVEQHRAAIDAARRSGVQHVAFTSMPRVDDRHPGGRYVQEYRQTEQVLRESGLQWTILQNAPYAEHQVARLATALRLGRLSTSAGDGVIAPVSRHDCAAVGVTVLTQSGYAGRTLVVTGGESFTSRQLATLAAEVSGMPLPVEYLNDEAMRERAAADGMRVPMPEMLTAHLAAVRLGYFRDRTDVVKRVTGHEPRTFREVLVNHRSALLPT